MGWGQREGLAASAVLGTAFLASSFALACQRDSQANHAPPPALAPAPPTDEIRDLVDFIEVENESDDLFAARLVFGANPRSHRFRPSSIPGYVYARVDRAPEMYAAKIREIFEEHQLDDSRPMDLNSFKRACHWLSYINTETSLDILKSWYFLAVETASSEEGSGAGMKLRPDEKPIGPVLTVISRFPRPDAAILESALRRFSTMSRGERIGTYRWIQKQYRDHPDRESIGRDLLEASRSVDEGRYLMMIPKDFSLHPPE